MVIVTNHSILTQQFENNTVAASPDVEVKEKKNKDFNGSQDSSQVKLCFGWKLAAPEQSEEQARKKPVTQLRKFQKWMESGACMYPILQPYETVNRVPQNSLGATRRASKASSKESVFVKREGETLLSMQSRQQEKLSKWLKKTAFSSANVKKCLGIEKGGGQLDKTRKPQLVYGWKPASQTLKPKYNFL